MNRTILISLGSAFALSACSSSSSRPATPEEADDVAQAITATVAAGGSSGDVASMTDAMTIALGATPRGFSRTTDGHIRGRRFNLDFSYALTCSDVTGKPLARCDATTDEATIDVAWSGNLDILSFESMANRLGTWTLTGLQSDTATLSGLSVFSYSATLTPIFRQGVTATYELDTAAAYDAIRIATATREIIGGAAIFDVSAHRTVTGGKKDIDTSFEVHAELTFHDDRTATLVIDGTRTYVIDLDTGRVVHVS
jgi:hypothetical protein